MQSDVVNTKTKKYRIRGRLKIT